MGTFLFSRMGVFWLWPLSCSGFLVSPRMRTELAPTVRGRRTQEIVSLTLEPMVIGPIFFNLICDRSRRLLHMTDWHILPGLKIDDLIACCRLPVSPQNTEKCSRYSSSGHLQKFATDLSLSTPQNSQPYKIVTLSLNSNQNLHTPAP